MFGRKIACDFRKMTEMGRIRAQSDMNKIVTRESFEFVGAENVPLAESPILSANNNPRF